MLKKILSLLRNQIVLLLLVLAVLLLAVFLAWPLFGAPAAHRKAPLLLLGGGGLLLIVVSAIPQVVEAARRRRAARVSIGQELNAALEALAVECPGRSSLYKVERALRLPWVLVLGSPGSGKAAALGHAKLARPFTDPAARSPLCTFWLAEDVIFVHPRARLRADEGLWKDFLGWLAERRRVNAVLLHLAAGDLLGRRTDELETLAGGLQRTLWTVAQKLGVDLPLQLMISQCDRLDGFVRFFADLPDAERAAPWGISLAGARDLQPLGELVTQGFAGLLGALVARVGGPFRRARTLEEQAAVLAFPQEVQRLGEALAGFVDALYPRGLGEGRPRLHEVCLCSTRQEGQVLPGGRLQLLVEGQLLRLAPGATPPPVNVGAFFLRQPLLRLQRCAALANRPRLRWHVAALLAAGVCCTGAGLFLGWGYAYHTSWLERTRGAVEALQALPPLARNSDEQLVSTELDKEEALRQELCQPKSQDPDDDQPDCVGEELTRAAHQQAVAYLGCRMGSQLVLPLATYDSSAQRPNELYSRLKDLAAWRKGQNGRVLLQGFNALKATTVLQKRNAVLARCPRPTGQDRRWLAEYLAGLWGHERAYGEPMRRNLGLFLKLYFKESQAAPRLVPHLAFDQVRVDRARENLVRVFGGSAGDGDAELLFYLSASELGLFASQPLLSGSLLKDEQRIEQLYTAAGCASFFNPKGQWDRWMSCVRDDELGAAGRPVHGSLASYYLGEHRRAWVGWLNGLQQKTDLKPDDLVAAGDAISSLAMELKQALLLVGRGPVRKADSKDKDKDKDPETCLLARRALAMIPFAAGDSGVETDADTEMLQQSYTRYQESLTKLGGMVKALAEWRPEPGQNVLKPADDAMQALVELGKRRAGFLAALTAALAKLDQTAEVAGGPRSQPPDVAGLNRVLAGFEEELREVIVVKLRQYLQGRWDALYGEWKGLHPRTAEEAASPELPASLRTFLSEKVAPFISGCVAPLYYPELASCRLKPPLADAHRQLLCATSCQQLERARELAARTVLPAPASPAPPVPVAYLEPTLDIPECPNQPQEVWLNIKELGLRYRCEASAGTCKTAGVPTGPASITVTYLPSRRSEIIASADLFIPLVEAATRSQPLIRRGDRVLKSFRGPGSCQIRLFFDPAMLVSRRAVRGPVSPLLTLTLPEQLVCQ